MAEQPTGTTPPIKIAVENVYKVFGPDPNSVMDRIRAGAGKAEILEQTGHTIGIRDVSLEMPAGRTFVVMGLSGSGKSTLIRHINRLIEPTAGRILVDGEDILGLDDAALRDLRRTKMSMVFQRFALLPHKTVLQNVMYGLELRGMDKAAMRARAMDQIELVGLSGFENQYPRQLSGGMQQRVGLARALATDAEILLMDEAFSALDPLIRHDMQEQLSDLQSRLHKTIVFITHDLDEALRLGDHIAILKDGELRQVGTAEDILLQPADDYVERFVRDVNRGRVVTLASIAAPLEGVRGEEASFERLQRQLHTAGSRAIFVLDEGGRPIGAVTGRTLDRHYGQDDGWWTRPENLEPIETAPHDQVVDEALPQLSRTDVPLAVVDAGGGVVGSVTRQAAVQALAKGEPVVGDADAESDGGSTGEHDTPAPKQAAPKQAAPKQAAPKQAAQ